MTFDLGTKLWNYQFWQHIVRHVDRVSMHHYGGVDEHALLGKLNFGSILNLLQQPQRCNPNRKLLDHNVVCVKYVALIGTRLCLSQHLAPSALQ